MQSYRVIIDRIFEAANRELQRRFFINTSGKFNGKIFGIGFGKTGTTSLQYALSLFGYKTGNQAIAEMLARYCVKEDYDLLVRYCYTADAFQDVPFFFPNVYEVLDKAFPGSKFILTIREDSGKWFSSFVKFHTKIFSSDKERPPTEEDLANVLYRYRGFCLDTARWFWGVPKVPLYSKKEYIYKYESHIEKAVNYFKDRPGDLLVINVSTPGSMQQLGEFLGIKVSPHLNFPWKNKT